MPQAVENIMRSALDFGFISTDIINYRDSLRDNNRERRSIRWREFTR